MTLKGHCFEFISVLWFRKGDGCGLLVSTTR